MASRINSSNVVIKIREKLLKHGGIVFVPLQRGGRFKVKLVDGGVDVSNLGDQPFLPWIVFQEAIYVLIRNNGIAQRGNAMDSRLGDKNLSLNSIEGHIAYVVYGKKVGDSVFRRISPIACILEWAGICRLEPGRLILIKKNLFKKSKCLLLKDKWV